MKSLKVLGSISLVAAMLLTGLPVGVRMAQAQDTIKIGIRPAQ